LQDLLSRAKDPETKKFMEKELDQLIKSKRLIDEDIDNPYRKKTKMTENK
jgi:hypothetical protein